jgi:predicted GNAT family acetyltransferase
MWSYNYTYPNYLAHYGVLGMKWGVRKNRTSGSSSTSRSKQANRLQLSVTTKNGETITATQDRLSLIGKLLGNIPSLAKQQQNTKLMSISDSAGNKVGDITLFHESPTSVNVTWVGINKNSRGKGYASAAMSMAETYARKTGAKQMTLEVPGNSPDARHIYEKQGFKSCGAISDPDDIWGGLTAMKKVF